MYQDSYVEESDNFAPLVKGLKELTEVFETNAFLNPKVEKQDYEELIERVLMDYQLMSPEEYTVAVALPDAVKPYGHVVQEAILAEFFNKDFSESQIVRIFKNPHIVEAFESQRWGADRDRMIANLSKEARSILLSDSDVIEALEKCGSNVAYLEQGKLPWEEKSTELNLKATL